MQDNFFYVNILLSTNSSTILVVCSHPYFNAARFLSNKAVRSAEHPHGVNKSPSTKLSAPACRQHGLPRPSILWGLGSSHNTNVGLDSTSTWFNSKRWDGWSLSGYCFTKFTSLSAPYRHEWFMGLACVCLSPFVTMRMVVIASCVSADSTALFAIIHHVIRVLGTLSFDSPLFASFVVVIANCRWW